MSAIVVHGTCVGTGLARVSNSGAWYVTCVGTGLARVSNSGAWYVCRDGACTCQQ